MPQLSPFGYARTALKTAVLGTLKPKTNATLRLRKSVQRAFATARGPWYRRKGSTVVARPAQQVNGP